MQRTLIILTLALALVLAMAGVALAGEWNPGHFNEPGGDLPAKFHANSECLFNGLDEPDESALGAGDGEPTQYFADDGFWSTTPAGGRVQSAGQSIVGGSEPGEAGVACNGHLNPLK
jgi:hypothetical protein